jgi:hypothetical protein
MPGPDGGREVVDGLGPDLRELALPPSRRPATTRPAGRPPIRPNATPPAASATRPASAARRRRRRRPEQDHEAGRPTPGPARRRPAARGATVRVGARGGRGTKNADQISSSPTPTPSPTSAPISALVEDRVDVDADPLEALEPRRHPAGATQLAGRPLEDRLGLDDVVLDAARHADDLVDAAYAVLVDAEVDDEVDRLPRDGGYHEARPRCSRPASSGSVHIFTSASRALLAWIVHMPGSP